MRQISKHDVNKLTAQEIQAQVPFLVVSDGVVIALVLPAVASIHDVNKPKWPVKANHDVNKANELKFSKASQAKGRMLH